MDLSKVPSEVWQNGIVAAALFLIALGLFAAYERTNRRNQVFMQRQVEIKDTTITNLTSTVHENTRATERVADSLEIIEAKLINLPDSRGYNKDGTNIGGSRFT